MKALDLIRDSGLPPEQHAIVEGAFEEAWLQIETELGSDVSTQHARIRLASIILLLTRIIKDDPERLKMAALRAFHVRHE